MYGTLAVGIGVISVALAGVMLVASGRMPVAVTRTSLRRPSPEMSSPASVTAPSLRPYVVGLKTIVAVHEAPAARVATQCPC